MTNAEREHLVISNLTNVFQSYRQIQSKIIDQSGKTISIGQISMIIWANEGIVKYNHVHTGTNIWATKTVVKLK